MLVTSYFVWSGCVWIIPACTFVLYVSGAQRSEEELDLLTGVIEGFEQLCGCWESNPGHVEKQPGALNH